MALKRKKLSSIPELIFKTIGLGNNEKIELVNFGEDFWMGTCEITNAQFRIFDSGHNSRYFGKQHPEDSKGDGKGMTLNDVSQPA